MNKQTRMIAAFLAVSLTLYLFGGFVAWDWNAANWHAVGRVVVGFLGIGWGVLAALWAGYDS
jgi:hypothetical protein